MRQLRSSFFVAIFSLTIGAVGVVAQNSNPLLNSPVPRDIRAIFNKPMYKGSTWALRVLTSDGKVLVDYNSQQQLFIGSVRKVFTVGQLLNAIGPDHTYDTPVYRVGTVDRAGVLHGNLVVVASGDLTVGGRTNPDGTIALSGFDHNEADSLGNAVLTAPDPLAGYAELAKQVAAAGIKKIDGDVVIDDRLFQAFDFHGEFNVTPIFVNDDVVDLTINPGATAGSAASVKWRPESAALAVDSKLMTAAAASPDTLKLDPEFPKCIGTPNCTASVTGSLPADYKPPLTNQLPLVQTFRIVNPTNYARTVFIEKLQAAGVTVSAPAVRANAAQSLPARDSYAADTEVAKLKGMPYSQDARFILKVSYNIGADTSLVLFGLTQGVDNMKDALAVEKQNLVSNYAIPADQFNFVDGSGGGVTTATSFAVTRMLAAISRQKYFETFLDALPSLGVDGSLGFVKDFEKDPALAGAEAKVHAKTGTFAAGSASGIMIKGQAFGGYIDARSGERLIYQLVVNNVPVTQIEQVMQIFQDEGTISAILWRDN